MSKKLMTGLLALVALAAMALPAMASANPILKEGETTLSSGAKIVGTNVGETLMKTSLGTVSCSNVVLKGTLTVNETAKGTEGDLESATFAGTGTQAAGEPDTECTSWAGGVSVTPKVSATEPWCLEATEANDTFKIRGGKCTEGTKPITYTMVFTSSLIGTCKYSRSTAAPGTLTTGTSEAHLTEQEWKLEEGGAGCASNGFLTMTFKAETENGTALTFSS